MAFIKWPSVFPTHRCEYVQVERTLTNKTCYMYSYEPLRLVLLLTALFFLQNTWFFLYPLAQSLFFLCAFGMSYTTKIWIIGVHIWNVIFWIDMPLWKESIHLKLTCSLVANCERCWTKDHIWINKYNNRVQFSIAWEWWLPWRPYCLTDGVAPCGGFHLGKYQFELSVL